MCNDFVTGQHATDKIARSLKYKGLQVIDNIQYSKASTLLSFKKVCMQRESVDDYEMNHVRYKRKVEIVPPTLFCCVSAYLPTLGK